mmetsp:Transcript_2182/g.3153  ORF Transcript_2182/g.3153 Transcript_2182/m.3153 type:complete len:375 (-) Transcript_2182:110-1234(-)
MTKVDAYVRQLIQSWVRSPAYHRKLTRTFDEKDEKDEKKDSSLTGRVRARICFIAISLTIIIGCNIFEESSQTVAYRAGKAWPYLLAYVVKFVGMWFYMLVNTSDPGYISGEKVSGPAAEKRGDYCKTCKHFKPQRAKHCRVCGRCVCRFDHHCPFMGNCIGWGNQKLFWWFLFFELVPAYASVNISLSVFKNSESMGHIAYFSRVLFCGFSILMAVFVTIIFIQQTYNISSGQTTYEMLLRNRIVKYSKLHKKVTGQKPPFMFAVRFLCIRTHAFDRGFFRNIKDFFCGIIEPHCQRYSSEHRNWHHLIPEVPKKDKKKKKSANCVNTGQLFACLSGSEVSSKNTSIPSENVPLELDASSHFPPQPHIGVEAV